MNFSTCSYKSMFWLVVACVFAITGCSVPEYQTLTIDQQVVSYRSEGTSPPTVVFESGLGDDLSVWNPVYEQLAQHVSVFSYSRMGYSGSQDVEEEDGKRTADEIAKRLKKVLESAGAQPPYILVGHSIGGLYVLKFAELYPHLTGGIVLVDGRPKYFRKECEKAGLSPCAPPDFLLHILPLHMKNELNGLRESEESAPPPTIFSSIPVTVIAAMKPPTGAPKGGQEIWLRVQREFASELAVGRFLIAKGSGHYIQSDRAEFVVQEILRLVVSI